MVERQGTMRKRWLSSSQGYPYWKEDYLEVLQWAHKARSCPVNGLTVRVADAWMVAGPQSAFFVAVAFVATVQAWDVCMLPATICSSMVEVFQSGLLAVIACPVVGFVSSLVREKNDVVSVRPGRTPYWSVHCSWEFSCVSSVNLRAFWFWETSMLLR